MLYRHENRFRQELWICRFENVEEMSENVKTLTLTLTERSIEEPSQLCSNLRAALRCELAPITPSEVQAALQETERWQNYNVVIDKDNLHILRLTGSKVAPGFNFTIPSKISGVSEVSLKVEEKIIDSATFTGLEGSRSLQQAMAELETKYAVCDGSPMDENGVYYFLGDQKFDENLAYPLNGMVLQSESGKPVLRSIRCLQLVKGSSPALCSKCRSASRHSFSDSHCTPIHKRSRPSLEQDLRNANKKIRVLSRNLDRKHKAKMLLAKERAEARGKHCYDINPAQSEDLETWFGEAVKHDLPHRDGCEDLKALVKSQQDILKLKYTGGRRSTIRWHPHVIRFTLLMVTSSGSKAARALRDAGFPLPSDRTIRKYRSHARLTLGESEKNIKLIKERLEKARSAARNEAKRQGKDFNEKSSEACVLFVDGMKIKNGLHYDRATGKVVGFDTLDDAWSATNVFDHFEQLSQEEVNADEVNAEDEIDEVSLDNSVGDNVAAEHLEEGHVQNENESQEPEKDAGTNCDGNKRGKKWATLPLGGELYVWMVKTPYFNFHHVVAVENVGTVNAARVLAMFKEANSVIERVGLTVVALVLDGASPHRKMIDSCAHSNGHAKYFLSDNDVRIWVLSDYVHLLKRLRNALYNRDFMELKGERLSWETITETWESCQSMHGATLIPKVRYEHIKLDSWSKMNVALATQVMSRSMADAIKVKFNDKCEQLSRFIELCDKFFDTYNKGKDQSTFQMPELFQFVLEWEMEAKESWENEKMDNLRLRNAWKKQKREGTDDGLDGKENRKSSRNEKVPDAKKIEEKKIEAEKRLQRKKRSAQSPMPTCLPAQLRQDLLMTLASTSCFYTDFVGEGKLLPSLRPKHFCQDILENFFSRVREACGAERNPQVEHAISAISTLQLLFDLKNEYKAIKSASGKTNCA